MRTAFAPHLRSAALFLAFLFCFVPVLDAQNNGKKELMQSGPKISTKKPLDIRPTGDAPEWAPDIDPQMQAVIEQLMSYEAPPFTELTAFQVRNAKLPAEAVADILKKTGLPSATPKVDISHRLLPVGSDDGTLVRIYNPLNVQGTLPVIVYYHGGGWVIADLETYEAGAMALAEKAGAIVVSVAYRQAPEHVFPTAHEDAFAAYQWIVENTDSLGGDPNRIATAGESAGGNLAVAVSLMARERNVKLPVHILSVYPIADGDTESDSYTKYAKALPLSKPFMAWFFDYYYPNWKTESTPWISLTSADLSGLPPVTIINAQIDPLESEGGELAKKFEQAGIDVERRVYDGVTHEFFGMAAVLEQAVDAQAFAVDRLKAAFKKK
ncbi:alpha/beta hydrolase [Lewinella sp. IMCC34183]|uniref:alpha/beta hydrolase n=1 Tax=Lewinella sp. IMCC34183 TaxID=2248762 RepID=UPI0018E53FF4|nr:alpha/beta hydrolase [Lewinella sp. IMCC34183]